ncbi:MAG TPA: hypothetical protein PKD90_10545, partial [Phnomibacter sp.]|nr:hypothetical protein [Phnomibacter sp.]
MRAVFLFLMAGIFYGQQVNAQLLKKLGDKVKQTTDKAADKIFGGGSKEAPGSQDAAAAGNEAKPMVSATKADLSAYGSYDFVPGDSVIFSDELTEDDLNEVPAKWLMEKGRGEVITHEDELVISTRAGTTLTPRMKNKNSYLPARFTIEFDVKFLNYNPSYGRQLTLQLANPPLDNNQDGGVYAQHAIKVWASGEAGFATSEGKWPFEHFDAANVAAMKQWKHIAIAVNEKGVKVYVNQFRILNAQVEFGKPSTLRFTTGGDYDAPVLIKNFRILAGGKNAARQITTQNLYIARGI